MAFGIEDRLTIFALASGIGKSAVSIIRLSGPKSSMVVQSLAGRLPEPRQASLCQLRNPSDDSVIDSGLILWFPGPRSFTGEDCAELQVHGSRAVIAALSVALLEMPGVRLANPGEFARRALMNGKLDLIAVEALADLINAETEQQRRLAIREMSGELSVAAESWRLQLIEALAFVETELDFSDEGDSPEKPRQAILAICNDLLRTLEPLVKDAGRAERLREGLNVLIAGPPNAGKSTLLNAIARRDIAIVTEQPGTTRDLIELNLDLGGYPVTLIDTAGIRVSDDLVEKIGIERALARAKNADLVLWLQPSSDPLLQTPAEFQDRPLWNLATKSDLNDHQAGGPSACFPISAKKGDNLAELITRLQLFAANQMDSETALVIANQRQRQAVTQAYQSIKAAVEVAAVPEFLAEELRNACFALETLIGKVGVEDVFDQLFARFCMGK